MTYAIYFPHGINLDIFVIILEIKGGSRKSEDYWVADLKILTKKIGCKILISMTGLSIGICFYWLKMVLEHI